MSAPSKSPTSPCKGEVDREAGGWGSRFSRTKDMTTRARSLRANMTDADDRRTQWLTEKDVTVVRYWNNDVLSNLEGVLSDLVTHIERLSQAETTPTPTLPLSGGGSADAGTRGKEESGT